MNDLPSQERPSDELVAWLLRLWHGFGRAHDLSEHFKRHRRDKVKAREHKLNLTSRECDRDERL